MKHFLVFLFCGLFSQTGFAQPTKESTWGRWLSWGAGRANVYNNPILPADYSDVDCIRVGSWYYAISSTFQYCPGVIILKSADLVNWQIVGHAVEETERISPEMNWTRMNRYGRGVWAGAIRYHADKFRIYFGTPDEGFFATSSDSPEGPWSPLRQVLKGSGWDDCCPFWDDDGQGYLVATHFAKNYQVHLFKMGADGLSLDSGSDLIIHQSRGSEANKMYKIAGWYYHLYSEVKPEGRVLMMERARKISGPFRGNRQLMHANKNANEPNQGGLVETPTKSWYFLTHHGSGDWSGRAISLLPVTWIDEWPIVGPPGPDGIGNMSWSGTIPQAGKENAFPQSSDEFDSILLKPQWEWNYQPRNSSWSLTERPGWLRLYANCPLKKGNLHTAANTITQRIYRTRSNIAVAKLDISGMKPGEHAGLAQYGFPAYFGIGVAATASGNHLEICENNTWVDQEMIAGSAIWLKATWGLDGKSSFSYSLDGKKFVRRGRKWRMRWESYRGSRIAIYNFNNQSDTGFVDIDFMRYDFH